MKKQLFAFVLPLLMTSCVDVEQKKMDSTPVVIGSAQMDGMEVMSSLTVGETDNQQIWLDYIQAHNEKDIAKIAAINAEDWVGYTADGSVVKGSKAHIEIMDNWFKTANPKWEVKWMIANAAKNKDGEMEQWLTTGNDYSDIDENGNAIFEHNVHDVQFVNGKIKKINVYKRAKAQDSLGFSY